MDGNQLNLGQLFGINTPPYISANRLPSPLFLHPILSRSTDCPRNFIQFDLEVDLPSVDPWASPPSVGDFDACRLLDTQIPGLPPSSAEFVPGTLLGSWGGSGFMNSPNAQDSESATLLSPPGEFGWGAELSNYRPMLSGTPRLEGCISIRKQYFTIQSSCSNHLAYRNTVNSIYRNINDIKVHKVSCSLSCINTN